MRIPEGGQITIPEQLRRQCGFDPDVDVDLTRVNRGLLIHKRTPAEHPVDRVRGILKRGLATDDFIDEIRGR